MLNINGFDLDGDSGADELRVSGEVTQGRIIALGGIICGGALEASNGVRGVS